MRACWLKWVGRDWSISADYIWLNYSGANNGAIDMRELLPRLAKQVVNAAMDAEADQLSGGGANSRNGYRERSLAPAPAR